MNRYIFIRIQTQIDLLLNHNQISPYYETRFCSIYIIHWLFNPLQPSLLQQTTPPATQTSFLDITGTWFIVSQRDSTFNTDGSLYLGAYYPRDTTVYGYKSCNYVSIQNNDTCLAGSCFYPGPSVIASYYKFISDSLFAEHAIQITSPFSDGFDKDTAKVIRLTSALLVLDRKGYQNRLDLYNGGYKTFYIHTIDSLFR